MADTSASLKNGAPEISSGAPVHKGSKMANPFKKLTAGSGSRTEILAMIGVGLVFLAIWEFLPPLLDVPRYIIPTFSNCLEEFGRMMQRENLMGHFMSTLISALIGFALGGLLGAASGYLLGLSSLWERVLSPYILALQIAPKVAFAPLFIMWFGYNAIPKLLVTVLIVFFPILVNVLQSMKTVDRDLVNLASQPVCRSAHRRDAGRDRCHRGGACRWQHRSWLPDQLRRRTGEYGYGLQRHLPFDRHRYRALLCRRGS